MESKFNPSNGKKVVKDIVYSSIQEIKNGNCDLAITINGKDLINMDVNEGLKIIEQNGLIKHECVIIPAGLECSGTTEYGGALEYNFNNGFIIVDLCLDYEDEYIA